MKHVPDYLLNLNPERIALLKSYFREDNMLMIESSYGGQRFGFHIPINELREKDSELLQPDTQAYGQLMITSYMNFIMRCNPIDSAFVDKYITKPWQTEIFKQCFFDFEPINNFLVDAEYDDTYVDNEYVLLLGYKRPFGNSAVLSDVLDVMDKKDRANAKRRDPDKVIDEAIMAVKNYLINGLFDPRLEGVCYDYARYELTPGYLRVNKLQKFGI